MTTPPSTQSGQTMIRELNLLNGGATTVDLRDVDSVERLTTDPAEGCLLHFCNRDEAVEAHDNYNVISTLWAHAISDPRFSGKQIMFHASDARVATLGESDSMNSQGVGTTRIISVCMSQGSIAVDETHEDFVGIVEFLYTHGLLLRE